MDLPVNLTYRKSRPHKKYGIPTDAKNLSEPEQTWEMKKSIRKFDRIRFHNLREHISRLENEDEIIFLLKTVSSLTKASQ